MVSATPSTIEQLASDLVAAADPETALRALSALRRELDAMEPVLVARARTTGATWSQVARSLGVSKQAAHRKHRRPADDAARSPAEPKLLVTGEARRSVKLAREEAARLGQPTVGTEHLLLGILRCQAGHAVKALHSLGVTHEEALGALSPTIGGQRPRSGAGDRGDGISPHARRILEGSMREALGRGDGYIGIEHLLLALLADSRNGAVQTLEALRVSPTQIRRRLDQEWLAAGQSA
jgi:transposase-like protein